MVGKATKRKTHTIGITIDSSHNCSHELWSVLIAGFFKKIYFLAIRIVGRTFLHTLQESASLEIRRIQVEHMDARGWDDIGYNFLVGGDGVIYVGRGWNQQGAHTLGYNTKSICIAFIGMFNITEPPQCQLIAAQKLIEEGVKLNKLAKDYVLYGHCQLRPFESPGQLLFKIIQKWSHWSPEIKPL